MKASKHWLYQRYLAVPLLFLLPWFAFSLVGKSYPEMLAYFQMTLPQIGLFLLILIAIFHALLGIDVVLDDYIHHDKIRESIKWGCFFLFVLGGAYVFTAALLLPFLFLSFLFIFLKGHK
ncbi:MAG: hypothetical protein CNLJKLNK_00161 [Holosporales bacterium]